MVVPVISVMSVGVFTLTLLENTFTVMEQQRMRPSEWYQSEYSYSDASMNMLKTVFGA